MSQINKYFTLLFGNDIGFQSMERSFSAFSTMFVIVFVFIIGIFIVVIAKGITQWGKNNNSPILTVDATVVSKRTDISHHSHNHHHDNSAGMMHSSTSSSYYVTFQVESGDRLEFHITGQEYGLLVEGDQGKLTFQGTRYKSFDRHRY